MNKNIISTYGYNHLDPGAPGNEKTFRICGAATRNETTVHTLCQLPAGHGTAHPGAGRCKLHGGSKMANPYSQLWRGRMKDIAEQVMEVEQVDPLDLLAELEVQRVLLAVMIDRINGVDPAAGTSGSAEQLPQGIQRSRVEQVIREEMFRPPKTSRRKRDENMNTMNTVVGGGLPNNDANMVPVAIPPTKFLSPGVESLDAGLLDQIRMQLNDIVTTVTRIVAQRNQTAMTKAEVSWLLMTMKEGMERFVPKENREAFIDWMIANLPGGKMITKEREKEDGTVSV